MEYKKIVEGVFLDRPNRFIANVLIQNQEVVCHVKNTGRCKELLVPGRTVYLEECDNPARKTKYDLVSVRKGSILINMDSQAPNQAVKEWLINGGLFLNPDLVLPERKNGDSRFDFYVEQGNRKAFIEVKGVTLEMDGVALFPDAPTERGLKHVRHLTQLSKEGMETYLIFVVQFQPVIQMRPNYGTHREFGEALQRAQKEGVKILCYDCLVTPNTMIIDKKIPVYL